MKNVDEATRHQRAADGSNEDGRRAFVRVEATGPVTVYDIALSRRREVAEGPLGEVMTGTLVSHDGSIFRSLHSPPNRES